jgi:hypothetical protein
MGFRFTRRVSIIPRLAGEPQQERREPFVRRARSLANSRSSRATRDARHPGHGDLLHRKDSTFGAAACRASVSVRPRHHLARDRGRLFSPRLKARRGVCPARSMITGNQRR